MTADRITRADLEQRAANVNRRLEGTGRYVVVQGRNGYIGLDEYAERIDIAGETRSDQMIRNIRCGTKGEIGEFLHAMMVGIDLARVRS